MENKVRTLAVKKFSTNFQFNLLNLSKVSRKESTMGKRSLYTAEGIGAASASCSRICLYIVFSQQQLFLYILCI